MYNFRDVLDTASGGNILPSEALQINGEYIENLILGYKTLSVSGRESLSPTLDYYETGVRDGAVLKSKKYPPRTIVVKYQLIANSSEEFRKAYNQLGGILNTENAELIFNDEPDKFFIGTPNLIGDIEAGHNAVIGEFELFCVDPFKYSVVEYEAEPDMLEGSILLDYEGTHRAYPILQADFMQEDETSEDGETEIPLTGTGDCGYIAFFNEHEKIIQIGNPDETDVEVYPQSQTLTSISFRNKTAFGTSIKNLYKVNAGITSSDSVVQTGSMGIGVSAHAVPAKSKHTSGTLLSNKQTSQGAPRFYYTVKAKTTNRTASSVKVTVSITTSLKYSSSYFGRPFGLKGSVYMGGSWHSVTIKKSTSYWKGKSAHVVNISFTVSGLSKETTLLTGIKFKVERTDNTSGYDTVTGELSSTTCNNLKIIAYTADTPASYYLTPSSYGTGSKWHGASVTRRLRADAAGEVGAQNGTLTFSNKMMIGSNKSDTKQYGMFQALLVTGSGTSRKIVAGVSIYKGSTGKRGKMKFFINHKTVYTTYVDLSNGNKRFCSGKSSSITKTGRTIKFNIGGIKKTFKDSDISNTLINEITFTMAQYGTKPKLKYNGLYYCKFVKNNCDIIADVPNKFSAGDVVEADCNDGKIYLNGMLEESLGALGNDWEEFYLTPGLNQIGFSYSDWTPEYAAPSFKVRYREVFL